MSANFTDHLFNSVSFNGICDFEMKKNGLISRLPAETSPKRHPPDPISPQPSLPHQGGGR